MTDYEKQGKKNKAAGTRFEKRVRSDLEKKGWIVDRWTNQVEFIQKVYEPPRISRVEENNQETKVTVSFNEEIVGKLVPAKPKFIYNPQLKRRIPIGLASGFPDFIVFPGNSRAGGLIIGAIHEVYDGDYRIIYGVECKKGKYLDKKEKEKCRWMLQNNIFSKILVAYAGKKRGEVIYEEFKQ